MALVPLCSAATHETVKQRSVEFTTVGIDKPLKHVDGEPAEQTQPWSSSSRHDESQPSPATLFISSQLSRPPTTPSPQKELSTHTDAADPGGVPQEKPGSTAAQSPEHPSLERVFPSSQASGLSTRPSPHLRTPATRSWPSTVRSVTTCAPSELRIAAGILRDTTSTASAGMPYPGAGAASSLRAVELRRAK